MSSPIAILGAGNMASALALRLMHHKRPVRLYCIEPDVEACINLNRCNQKYLPGHQFQEHVSACADISKTIEGAEVIFLAVPSFAMRDVIRCALPHLPKTAILASITKGLDAKTLEPLAIAESKLLPAKLRKRLVSLGGPAVATEMAQGSPMGIVAASQDRAAALTIKRLLENDSIKVDISQDVRGVGLASALKNPYAIALGMCDGLKLPTNAKAFVFTLAVQEMAAILHAAKTDPRTITGLAGIGDLTVTGFSMHGRNRTYGERLVHATTRDPKILGLNTVEGITATPLALGLVKKHHVQAPLLTSIGQCLRAKQNFTAPFTRFLRTFQFPT